MQDVVHFLMNCDTALTVPISGLPHPSFTNKYEKLCFFDDTNGGAKAGCMFKKFYLRKRKREPCKDIFSGRN
jgi:hypothetical protein